MQRTEPIDFVEWLLQQKGCSSHFDSLEDCIIGCLAVQSIELIAEAFDFEALRNNFNAFFEFYFFLFIKMSEQDKIYDYDNYLKIIFKF